MPHHEIHSFDFETFTEIKGNPASGEIVRNSRIGACGPLKMQTRKVERLSGSMEDGEWKLVKSNSYDNKGRIVRELYGTGDIDEYVYDGRGRLVNILRNKEPIFEAVFQKNGRLKSKKYLDEDGNACEKIFNSDGKLLRRTVGSETMEEHEYNRDGDISVSKFHYNDGNLDTVARYFYNDDGTFYKVFQYQNGEWIIIKRRWKVKNTAKFGVDLWIKKSSGTEIVYDPESGEEIARGYKKS